LGKALTGWSSHLKSIGDEQQFIWISIHPELRIAE
jgi:hypothetical protein